MAQASVQGSFVWQELVTADTTAAGSFYPRVLGWRSQSSPHSSSYTMFTTASGPVAGMMRLPDELRQRGVPSHWLPYVGADDVDATVASAERLGAKVHHGPSDIQDNVGRFAVLTDPHGAAFGIYRPGQSMSGPPRGAPGPGQHSWHELATTDAEAAFEFYSKLFGWQAMQRMDMGPAGTYLIFGRDGTQRGGMYKLSRTGAPHWLSYIEVANADAAADVARDAGAKVINGPMDVPGGRIVQLADPAGVLFAVHSSKAAAHAAAQPAGSDAGAAKPAAPKPAKRVESETPRAGSSASGRGDGSKVTAGPAGASSERKASGASRAASGASARPPSRASRPASAAASARKPAAAKKAKKAPPKKAPAKKAAAKKAGRKKAAVKKSAARGGAAKRGGRAAGGMKKKAARRAGGRRAAGKSAGRRSRHR